MRLTGRFVLLLGLIAASLTTAVNVEWQSAQDGNVAHRDDGVAIHFAVSGRFPPTGAEIVDPEYRRLAFLFSCSPDSLSYKLHCSGSAPAGVSAAVESLRLRLTWSTSLAGLVLGGW